VSQLKCSPTRSLPARVRVVSPSRLHFGLLNETGLFGRVDGGIGVSLADPFWDVELLWGDGSISGTNLHLEHTQAIEFALRQLSFLVPLGELSVTVYNMIPCHVGLGSKTSLLMAIGTAVSTLVGRPICALDLARILKRGGTSGVGVYSFEGGNFIWDGGHSFPQGKPSFGPSSVACALPPPRILSLPVDWIDVVHFRFHDGGLHGQREVEFFRGVCPIDEKETLTAVSCVVSEILPSLLERDASVLQRGLNRLQAIGFKRLEWEIQDEITLAFREYWNRLRVPEALCLSSFGPTLFVFTDRPSTIRSFVNTFDSSPQNLTMTSVSSHGGTVKEVVYS
jgi:beta-ribofuranosylaminobenzene 5'-phosphate synthase